MRLVVLALLVLTAPAYAQEYGCDWGKDRVLGRNSLLFPKFVNSAVVASTAWLKVGGESVTVTDIPFQRLGLLNFQAVTETVDLGLQVKVIDRLAVFGRFTGTIGAATDLTSLILQGSTYDVSFGGGLLLKIVESRQTHTLVSVRLAGSGGGGKTLTLLPLLDALSVAPIHTAADVFSGDVRDIVLVPFSESAFSGDVAAAQAFSPIFSLQGSLGVSFERQTNRYVTGDITRSTFRPRLELAVAADTASVGVPLALMLEYELSLPNITREGVVRTDVENIGAVGLYYSGRPDVQAGILAYAHFGQQPIQGRDETGAPADSGPLRTLGGELSLRYAW